MAGIEGKRISELATNASVDGTAIFPHTQNNATMKVTLSALATFILSQVNESVVADAVSAWLTAHPEATTTVEDGSISTAKLANGAVTTEKLADGTIISLLPSDFKTAILQLASKVAYIDEHGQDYYDDLYDALYPPIPATAISLSSSTLSFSTIGTTQTLTATVTPSNTTDTLTWSSSDESVATVSQSGVVTTVAYGSTTITATAGSVSATCSVVVAQIVLSSITATYTQSGTVYDSATLDSLKSDLVVTANWSNDTQTTVAAADYTLSGTLAVGTSTITASYGGKSDTFTVTVTATPTLSSISAVYTQSGTVYDNASLDSLKSDLVVTAHWSDNTTSTVPSADYTLSGTLAAGTSTITVSYEGKTTTFSVTVTHYTRLPSGYDEVAWISSFGSGQSYNTYPMMEAPADDVIELQFNMVSNGGGGNMFKAGGNTTCIAFYNGGIYYDLNSARAGFLGVTLNAVNTVRFSNHYITNVATGVTKSNTTQTGLGDLNWQLGHGGNETAQGQQIIYIKQYHGEVLVRHLIPCKRTSDNQAGYYDIVQNEFIYGTRTFATGSVV